MKRVNLAPPNGRRHAAGVRTLRSLGALAALLWSAPAALRSDVAPWPPTAGTSLALAGPKSVLVVMVEEHVTIRVSPTATRTRAIFTLRNTGGATEIEVGFPYQHDNELLDFAAAVDGQTVSHHDSSPVADGRPSLKASRLWMRWKLWRMAFAAGATHTVEVSYSGVPAPASAPFALLPFQHTWLRGAAGEEVTRKLTPLEVDYVLWTGGLWKGPIGRCRIEVTFEGFRRDQVLRVIGPAPSSESPRGMSWDLEDFKPVADIHLEFLPYLTRPEVVPFLESLQAAHPDDPLLAQTLGYEYQRDELRRADLFARFLRGWHLPVSLKTIGDHAPRSETGDSRIDRAQAETLAAQRSCAVWQMAARGLEAYDRLGKIDQARSLVPVVCPIFEHLLRELEDDPVDYGRKRWDRQALHRSLDLCDQLVPPQTLWGRFLAWIR
jgi:hypothetical protein